MKKLNFLLIVMAWCLIIGLAQANNLSNVAVQNKFTTTSSYAVESKAPYSGPEYKPDPNVILQGGDTFATAVNIPALPYGNAGTTVGYINNYDAVCPYVGSTSPDVVYKYTPTVNVSVDITLCANTAYDSKLYVHANAYVLGAHIACNDDICSTPSYPSAYVSKVLCVPMTVGNTYYITVDGYGTAAGTYTIDVTPCVPPEPCVVNCPLGGIPEGEPDCGPGYVDNYNGGCNSTPFVFQPITCGDTICGTSGVFDFGGLLYRDTDWYELNVTQNCDLTWCGVSEFGLLMFIMDAGSGDCVDYTILTYGIADPCTTLCLTVAATPGTYWLWIGPSDWNVNWPCPSDYVAWVSGNCCLNCDIVAPDQVALESIFPPGDGIAVCDTLHEIWPVWCRYWHVRKVTSLSDSTGFAGFDFPIGCPDTLYYHYSDVTIAGLLNQNNPADSLYVELLDRKLVIGNPVCTYWHELRPQYCRVWHIDSWQDNGNGYLDPCDYVMMRRLNPPGVEWYHVEKLVSGVDITDECCDVNMVPDQREPATPPGGFFGLTGIIGNPTLAPIITDVWVGVIYLNTFYQLWLFNNIPLNSGQYVSAHLNQSVPNYAPPGVYTYIAYCGDRPTNIKCDSASFMFTVTTARIEGGADEWTLEGGFGEGAPGESIASIPAEYALWDAYPNPFNATTSITYELPEAADVRIEVFNLMGQKVATLVDGHIEAGQHTLSWDAANYSSGLYFYKMIAGERVFAKRMTLLK